MKDIRFLGNSESQIEGFPANVKIRVLHELDRVRHGLDPTNWKPMKTVGIGVREVRVRSRGAFRVIYLATRSDAVYVLHAFRKNTARTRQQDINLAQNRMREI